MPGLTPAEAALFGRHVPEGSRILDLGVGTGRTTPWLTERGGHYVGLDYAAAMIEAARQHHPGVEFREADASDLSAFGDASFDVVVFSYNGIDLLADDARARCLDEIHRVLVPGGTYLFSSHDPRHLFISGAAVPGPRVKRWAAAALGTARRLVTRLPNRAFRTGSGWVMDHARGGLQTHMAIPTDVERELAEHGFRVVEQLNGNHPSKPSTFRTPWWYYAAQA